MAALSGQDVASLLEAATDAALAAGGAVAALRDQQAICCLCLLGLCPRQSNITYNGNPVRIFDL